jgi:predicted Rossmann fold flavoprotein
MADSRTSADTARQGESATAAAGARGVDVVVVGGGAAGLMASIQAARRGRRTVLLEKNLRLGLKILISGGGRCNLTTTMSGRELEAEYGTRRGRWLRHALRSFQPKQLVAMIEAGGVPLQEEDLDKIFPVSARAGDILQCLLRLADDAGVDIRRDAPMLEVSRAANGEFVVTTPNGDVCAASLVLSTGGLSYPKTGSTGDGYRVTKQLGHGLVPTVPHLAPLAVAEPWVRDLAGIVLNDAVIAVADRHGRVLCRRRRPILFTHKGLSGPGPMDLSGFVEAEGGQCEVVFDFVPDVHAEELARQWMELAKTGGKRGVANALPRELPERLRQTLTRLADAEGTVAELSRDRRRRLLQLLKDCRVPVDRSLGLGHAEVTRGGIPLDEVDGRTMESKLVEGLFLCGEILDIDGPIGGFNFQAAFATARLAGLHA